MLILAGLRRFAKAVEQEARKMPIHIDILENEVLGPVFKKGLQEGELTILRRQIEKRFGSAGLGQGKTGGTAGIRTGRFK